MRILLIDREATLAHQLQNLLKSAGVMDRVETGAEGLELAKLYDYDIILLDIALSDRTGHDVLRSLRAARINTPVLVLSGCSRPEASIESFALGADDVLAKPFDPAELLARVQAIIRRAKGFSASTLSVGPLTLCLHSHEVKVNGTPLNLTTKEYAVLELLVLRRGLVLTKQAFLDHLYGGMDEPEMKIIDVFICNLRKKMAKAGASGLIETVWGRGYILRMVPMPAEMQASVREAALV